ncbi:MAG: monovalent cation:proton antiporter-2 (CPA2) family protein [Rickettsiales bacterium]|nr:monovalent cation:proton antiporter-2 (CPA2) family protein [Rickettsiales bacterium]
MQGAHFLTDIVLLLAASVGIVALFKKLNLSPVLGYLVVGGIIGPQGFKVITETEQIKHLAELGVVFLLFAIALELSLERLIAMRKHVFGFGGLQVLICGSVFSAIAYFISNDFKIAFVTGFVFALSSTPVIFQVLKERGEENTQHGRLSIATLILQDLAFIPLLIVIPMLADEKSNIVNSLALALVQGFVVMVIIVLVGKKLFGPIFRVVASLKSQELFVALMFFIVLGSALFSEKYGMSLAFGAFIAGLLIAETEFRAQVETDIKPFKGIFLGLFFITVGMKIDYSILIENIFTIFLLISSTIILKSSIITALAKLFGFRNGCAVKTGFMLSQVSEFGFVLFAIANQKGFLPDDLMQIFVVTISVSMAITPLIVNFGSGVARRVEMKNPLHYESSDISNEINDIKDHIILVGFDKIGRTTAELLKNKDIKFVALDDDPRDVHQGRKDGFQVYFGKCNILENLEKLGVERASAVVLTSDIQPEVLQIANQIKRRYPNLRIIARAKDRAMANELKNLGVDISIAESFESSLMIGSFIMHSLGINHDDIEQAINQFRLKKHPDSKIYGSSVRLKEDLSAL